MSDFWRGVLTVPDVLAAVALVAAAILLGGAVVSGLAQRFGLGHWSLAGPMRRSADVGDLFRRVNARGRHMSSFRRVIAVGPFTLYLARYQPGHVEEQP